MVILFFTFLSMTSCSSSPVTYFQHFVTKYTYKHTPRIAQWPELPFGDVQSASTLGNNEVLFLSTSGLFQYQTGGNAFSNITGLFHDFKFIPGSKLVSLSSRSFLMASFHSVSYCEQNRKCEVIGEELGVVNDMAFDLLRNRVFVAADDGLFVVTFSPLKVARVKIVFPRQRPQPFYTVAVSRKDGVVAAGTIDLVWRTLKPGNLSSFTFFRVPGIIDDKPTAMTFHPFTNDLWIVNAVCINFQKPDLTFVRLGPRQGLPTDNLGQVAIDGLTGDVFVGSLQGVVRLEKGDPRGKWHYYYGARYLPSSVKTLPSIDQQVLFMVSCSSSDAKSRTNFFITTRGLSIFELRPYTLLEKSNYLGNIIEKYFYATTPEPHPYVGRFIGMVHLSSFGDMSTWTPLDDDNSGLNTAIYLIGECFHYAVTREKSVKEKAWKYFEGMEFLNNVTGIAGLPARTVLYNTTNYGWGVWYNSTVYPGWVWKGDASSDEIDGHLAAYPLVYHLLAETPSEKARALRLMDNMCKYIIKNNYRLIDASGKPTTWGNWDPASLNDDPWWYDDRGVNSMQMLQFIYSAYSITKNPYYVTPFNSLVEQHNYHINILNAKITQPDDFSFVDDQLLLFTYMGYAVSRNLSQSSPQQEKPKSAPLYDIYPYFLKSFDRTFSLVRRSKLTPWFGLFMMANGSIEDQSYFTDAIQTLREVPMDGVLYPVNNSERLDILFDYSSVDRKGYYPIIELLPLDEIIFWYWGDDLYDLNDAIGDGMGAQNPCLFTVAYWFLRWLQFPGL